MHIYQHVADPLIWLEAPDNARRELGALAHAVVEIATRDQAMGKSRDIGIARSHRIHDLAGLDYAAFMEALAIEGDTALLSQGRDRDTRAKALDLLEPCPKIGVSSSNDMKA